MKTIVIGNKKYEVEDAEFDRLFMEQSSGKVLDGVNGKVVAVEYVPTQEEINNQQILYKIKRLEELTKDLAQVQAGLIIEDIEDRKSEFRTLLNEVRVLQGKEPRKE
jgi:hypothetical protein